MWAICVPVTKAKLAVCGNPARGGVAWVGYSIAAAAVVSFLAVLSMPETRHSAAG